MLFNIEITEGTAMKDIDLAVPNLNGLHDLGIDVSIDDFGTGYSSLNYLKRLPVHKLKIDQSFIRGVDEDPDDQSIVRAVIAMGHNLKMQVIAEGVETIEQLDFLRDNMCDEMQGFLFSRPVPPEEVEKLLQTADSVKVPTPAPLPRGDFPPILFPGNCLSNICYQ